MVEVSELKALNLFNTISEEQLLEVARITNKKTYKNNSFIYQQGQPAREFFIVASGLVSLRGLRDEEEELEKAFELCEPGDLLGAASLVNDRVYTLTALCLEDTDIFFLNAGKLLNLCEVDYELGYRLMKKVAEIYFERYETAKRELGIPMAARSPARS